MGQSWDGQCLLLQGLGVLEGHQKHPWLEQELGLWLELQELEWP